MVRYFRQAVNSNQPIQPPKIAPEFVAIPVEERITEMGMRIPGTPIDTHVVQDVVEFFHLHPTKSSTQYVNKNRYEVRIDIRGKHFQVRINQLNVTECEYPPSLNLHFTLRYMGGANSGNVLYKDTLLVTFPTKYPLERPMFDLQNGKQNSLGLPKTRVWFCIMARGDAWKKDDDTIISGIFAAFDWIVLQFLDANALE